MRSALAVAATDPHTWVLLKFHYHQLLHREAAAEAARLDVAPRLRIVHTAVAVQAITAELGTALVRLIRREHAGAGAARNADSRGDE